MSKTYEEIRLAAELYLAESPIRNEPKAKFIIVPAKLRKFCDWIRSKIYATLIFFGYKEWTWIKD